MYYLPTFQPVIYMIQPNVSPIQSYCMLPVDNSLYSSNVVLNNQKKNIWGSSSYIQLNGTAELRDLPQNNISGLKRQQNQIANFQKFYQKLSYDNLVSLNYTKTCSQDEKLLAEQTKAKLSKQKSQKQSVKNNCSLVESMSLKSEKYQEMEAEYQGDQQNQGNYPKKNTQSNIVNQIFSYISTESKSQTKLKLLIKDDKKVASFYQILKSIKKRKKKYINRKYLCTLCTIGQKQMGYKMLLRARNRFNALSIPQFQKNLSTLIIYYLNKQAQINVITSKKINKLTYQQHLQRRREIKQYLLQKFRSMPPKWRIQEN